MFCSGRELPLEMSSFLCHRILSRTNQLHYLQRRNDLTESKKLQGVQSNWETFILKLRKRKKQYPWAFTQTASFASPQIHHAQEPCSAVQGNQETGNQRKGVVFTSSLVSYFPVQAETERNDFENAINNKCFTLKTEFKPWSSGCEAALHRVIQTMCIWTSWASC